MHRNPLYFLLITLILTHTSCVKDIPPWQVDGAVYRTSSDSVYVVHTDKTATAFQTRWGIVTNSHAVEDLSELELVTSTGIRYDIDAIKRVDCKAGNYLPLSPIISLTALQEAEEVFVYDWGKLGIDLALIRARVPAVQDLPLADSVQIGEKVFTIGHPRHWQNGPSAGFVTDLKNENGVEIVETAIRVRSGLSGSPLLNRSGQVAGVIYGVTHLGDVLAIHVDEFRRLFASRL